MHVCDGLRYNVVHGPGVAIAALDSFVSAHQTSRWLTTHILWR
jgi:hypothetical protein